MNIGSNAWFQRAYRVLLWANLACVLANLISLNRAGVVVNSCGAALCLLMIDEEKP